MLLRFFVTLLDDPMIVGVTRGTTELPNSGLASGAVRGEDATHPVRSLDVVILQLEMASQFPPPLSIGKNFLVPLVALPHKQSEDMADRFVS